MLSNRKNIVNGIFVVNESTNMLYMKKAWVLRPRMVAEGTFPVWEHAQEVEQMSKHRGTTKYNNSLQHFNQGLVPNIII